MSSSGANLHQLLSGWPTSPWLCCGHWTPNGRFFPFLSGDTLLRSAPFLPGAKLRALDGRRSLFRKPPSQPIPLTSGPTLWGAPIPARDGKKIFARGVTLRGELVRFDSQSNQFLPYLGGIFPPSLCASPRTVGKWLMSPSRRQTAEGQPGWKWTRPTDRPTHIS